MKTDDVFQTNFLAHAQIWREKYHQEKHAGNIKEMEHCQREFEGYNRLLVEPLKLVLEQRDYEFAARVNVKNFHGRGVKNEQLSEV